MTGAEGKKAAMIAIVAVAVAFAAWIFFGQAKFDLSREDSEWEEVEQTTNTLTGKRTETTFSPERENE